MKKYFKEKGSALLMIGYFLTESYYFRSYSGSNFYNFNKVQSTSTRYKYIYKYFGRILINITFINKFTV